MAFIVKARSGSYEYDTEIKTVSYWTNFGHYHRPVTTIAIEAFLLNYSVGEKVVITADGELYSTTDTPGYCDGDRTTTIDSIKALIV